MKHTKGKWNFLQEGIELQGGDCHEVMSGIKDMPIPICDVPISQNISDSNPHGKDKEYHISKEESIANGRLIAAAPELLEILEESLIYIRYNDPVTYAKAIKVINKAKGE